MEVDEEVDEAVDEEDDEDSSLLLCSGLSFCWSSVFVVF